MMTRKIDALFSNRRSFLPRRRIQTLLAILSLPISGFTTDIYIPSLPDMGAAFHATSIQIQVTIPVFLISYGIGQLFIGGLLDSFGRYWINLLSLVLFSIASLCIARLSGIYAVYCMRLLQGLAVSAIVVAKRAFFVDVYSGKKLAHYLSMFSIIWSTGPIVAPFIGGYLQSFSGWRADFYFLSISAFLLMVGELIFGAETLRTPAKFNIQRIVHVYRKMLKSRPFISGILIVGLSYAVMMIYNMTASFIIEHHFGYSEITTGFCSLILGLSWLAGGLLGRFTMKAPISKRLLGGLAGQLLFIVFMLVTIQMADNLYTFVLFASFIQLFAGFIFNILLTFCMGMFPESAGISIGLTGGINLIAVSMFSYAAVRLIPVKNGFHLAGGYLILTLPALIAVPFILYSPWNKNRVE